jgi:hypothetical protein
MPVVEGLETPLLALPPTQLSNIELLNTVQSIAELINLVLDLQGPKHTATHNHSLLVPALLPVDATTVSDNGVCAAVHDMPVVEGLETPLLALPPAQLSYEELLEAKHSMAELINFLQELQGPQDAYVANGRNLLVPALLPVEVFTEASNGVCVASHDKDVHYMPVVEAPAAPLLALPPAQLSHDGHAHDWYGMQVTLPGTLEKQETNLQQVLEQLFTVFVSMMANHIFNVHTHDITAHVHSINVHDTPEQLPSPLPLSTAHDVSSTDTFSTCTKPCALTLLAGITPAGACTAITQPPAYLLHADDVSQQAASPFACLLATVVLVLLCATGRQQTALARVLTKLAMKRNVHVCAAVRGPGGVRRRRSSNGGRRCRSLCFALLRLMWAFMFG